MIEIRKYIGSDAEELSVLIRDDLKYVNYEDPAWENEWLYARYTPAGIAEIAGEGHTYVVTDTDTGELLGTGTIKRDGNTFDRTTNLPTGKQAEIMACFIKRGHLRMHLGTLLFDALEADEIFTESQRVWLTTSVYARKFYENRNYIYSCGYLGKNADNLIEMEKRHSDGIAGGV